MITLITGTPGAGKTAWLVNEIHTIVDRPLFVHGIPGLLIPHQPIYCQSDLCEYCQEHTPRATPENPEIPEIKYVENWHEWAPNAAIIVIDEVQRVWRPRSAGGRIPDSVAKLETHRHRGIDFYLVSQGPHLFDSNVRRLIGRHIHLIATWAGRKQYEWPSCHERLDSTGDAVVRPYKLPAKIFEKYKSATDHFQQPKRKPISFYIALAVLIIIPTLCYFIYTRISRHMEPQQEQVQQGIESPTSPGSGLGGKPVALADGTKNQEKNYYTAEDWEPRIKDRPETAPAYDGILKVSQAPMPDGCLLNKKKQDCRCFTKQATPYPMAYDLCVQYVQNHVFNPFLTVNHKMGRDNQNNENDHQNQQNVNSRPNHYQPVQAPPPPVFTASR